MEQRIEMRGGGSLTFRQEGTKLHLEVERPEDGRGLFKAWLRGSRGGKLLLGTLAPERGRLRLRRTLSLDTLERAGCWPEFWAEALLAFSFQQTDGGGRDWRCEQHPECFLSDPALRRQIQGAMLYREEEDGFSLAVPFRTDAPVVLTGLFCLAQTQHWNGRLHLVWRFDKTGWPRLPQQEHSG